MAWEPLVPTAARAATMATSTTSMPPGVGLRLAALTPGVQVAKVTVETTPARARWWKFPVQGRGCTTNTEKFPRAITAAATLP
jgi:hypothetical protein